MTSLFLITKCSAFTLNVLCLLIGVAVITTNALGLAHSIPSTDEHAYFIVGIILGGLAAISTLLGCYGIAVELLALNIIYGFFLSILLIMQYLQMNSFPVHSFYASAVERLEHAWRLVDLQPHLMHNVESMYHCCGLYDSRDYNYKGVEAPESCHVMLHSDNQSPDVYVRGCLEALHEFYQESISREKIFNWILLIVEALSFLCAIILSVLIYYRDQASRNYNMFNEGVRGPPALPRANHVNSRTRLLSN